MIRLRKRGIVNPGGLHEQEFDRWGDTRNLTLIEKGLLDEDPKLAKRFQKLDRQGRLVRLWRKRPRPIRNRNWWVIVPLVAIMALTININKASLGEAWDNNVKAGHDTISNIWNQTPWGNHDVADAGGKSR